MNTLKRILGRAVNDVLRRVGFKRKRIRIAAGSYIHPRTTIGRCTRINAVSHVGECAIGAFCAIGGRLVVRSSNHRIGYLNIQDWAQKMIVQSSIPVAGLHKGKVVIGNAVWIGDSVVILPGVEIGNGAVIGAGSVVTKSVPAFAVAVGNPARVIRMRFSEAITQIVSGIEWWNWPDEKIQKHRKIFEIDLATAEPDDLRDLMDREGLQK